MIEKCYIEFITQEGDKFNLCRRKTFADNYLNLKDLPQSTLLTYLRKCGADNPQWVVSVYKTEKTYRSGVIISGLTFSQALAQGQLHF